MQRGESGSNRFVIARIKGNRYTHGAEVYGSYGEANNAAFAAARRECGKGMRVSHVDRCYVIKNMAGKELVSFIIERL